MPASVVSVAVEDGVQQFYCPFCAATVFDEDRGMAEAFCRHVRVFVHWGGELAFSGDSLGDLADQLDEIDPGDPKELSALFGDDAVVFELIEPGRGGGHDGGSCLVVIAYNSGLGES